MGTRSRSALLWILSFVLVLGAATWQRLTGPSYPLRGAVELADGSTLEYRLVRNHTTDTDAELTLPAPDGVGRVELHYRRHGTGEPFATVSLDRDAGPWRAHLPRQPAAGKLDYYLTVDGETRVPAGEGEFAVIRFKDPVPAAILVPHILMMFVGMLCGVRATLAAFLEPARTRRLARVTLFCLTLGGLVLGPIVQKYAFGAFWTGWPVGEDLTDTKTLVMWAGWAVAVLVLGRSGPVASRARWAVTVAAALMIAVYLVPHSLRGSTLDYEQLEQGVPVDEAIRTG